MARDGSVDLAILFRTGPVPRDGDTYLVEAPTYLMSAAGDPLTSKPTVPFSALHDLPLVLFCRPSSARSPRATRGRARHHAQCRPGGGSLRLQAHIVADGGAYALLGPHAIAGGVKDYRLQSSRLIDPPITRHIALAMSRHGEMTLACRTVMQVIRIAKSGRGCASPG